MITNSKRYKLKITVVTVVYNAFDTIESTVKSVLEQTYRNIEYIIIDGLSSDGTLERIKSLILDTETILVSERDMGIYDAMNKALRCADGDYLIFINAGDIFFNSDVLKSVEKRIGENLNLIYYGDAYYANKDTDKQTFRGGLFSKYRLAISNICHQTIFYPKKVYKRSSYNLEYKLQADYAYNLENYTHTRFVYMPLIIAVYDDQGISSTTKDLTFANDHLKLTLKSLGWSAVLYRFAYSIMKRLNIIT